MNRSVWLPLAVLVLAACNESHHKPGDTITKVVGPAGGTVELPSGASVVIPPDALGDETSIAIRVLAPEDVQELPSDLEVAGVRYAFTPHGTRFSRPVTIELPFEGTASRLRAMRLDDEEDTTWQAMMGGTTRDGVLSVQSMTFSVVTPARSKMLNGMDAGPSDGGYDAHVEPTVTWHAQKTTLDVWWPATHATDPGRDTIEVYALTRTTGACDDEASETIVKLCGIELPTFTSDPACDAFQLTIADAAWDSPNMPTFTVQANIDRDVDAGGIAAKAAIAVIGIDVGRDDAWPTSEQTPSLSCGNGSGAACFPDHDDDGMPGVTVALRRDAATYVGPYDDGLCTVGLPYTFRGLPTGLDLGAGGGYRVPVRSDQVNVGLRAGVAAGACEAPDGAGSDRVDLAVAACAVDSETLDPNDIFDHRLETMDYACTAAERRFVGEILPQYRALSSGERPGEARRPLGWIYNGRDIDRRVSEGPRTVTVALDTDGGGEPTCAQVRATVFE